MTTDRRESWAAHDPAALMHELEVHQAELEAQNCELQATNEELQRTNDALVVARDQFRALYEAAPTPYVTIDVGRTIVDLNRAATVILGATRDQLLGGTLELFVDDAGRARFRAFVDEVFAGSHARCGDLVLTGAAAASIDVQIDGVVLHDVGGPPRCVLAVVDITMRKLAEMARRRAQDEVLAIVSHDLRGPLNAIGLACDALASGLDPDDHEECIAAIGRATARCERLIKDLLGVAHLESGRLQLVLAPLDIGELARQVCHDHERAAVAARSELAVSVDNGPLSIVGDHDRLHQVLSNLIGNALIHARGAAIAVDIVAHDADVVITVADDGPGIAPEDVPVVFERYRQGARHHGGAGLGLAIVKGLVEVHGGTIALATELGHGARFTVTLPRGGPAAS